MRPLSFIVKLVLTILALAILVSAFLLYPIGAGSEVPAESTASVATIEQPQVVPLPVTVISLKGKRQNYVSLLGTVRAQEQAEVSAGASGQIRRVRIEEGDFVEEGDTLFEISGSNGTVHPSELQVDIARANYVAAQRNLEVTIQSNDEGLNIAGIQRKNALDEVKAANIDQDIFSHNILNAINTVSILDYSLQATRYKNALDTEKQLIVIKGLERTIRDTEDSADDQIEKLKKQRDALEDSAARKEIQKQITALRNTTDMAVDSLRDQLASARITLESLGSVTALAETQLAAQIQASKNQANILALTKDSTAARTGLSSESSNAVRLAEENIQTVLLRNAALLTQAQTQLESARLNMEMAQNQTELLDVRSPISGIVESVSVNEGEGINLQEPLARIISEDRYELVVPIDAVSAPAIDPETTAMVDIGGVAIPVSVKSVSPVVDPRTKFVDVVLALPRIFVRENDTLTAHIPLRLAIEIAGQQRFFIPLDAVTIGTQEQFVYVNDDGTARKVMIVTGAVFGDQIEVVSGLTESDEVIVEGSRELVEGQPVITSNE